MAVVPVLKSSRALRASYLCALVTRADIAVMSTYILTWGVNTGIARGLEPGAATSLAKWPILIITITSLVCFPCIGILLDKKGRVFTLLLSISFSAIAMLLVALAPDPFSPLCYIAAVLAGFGMSGSIAGANTLAIDASPSGMSGSVMGGLNTMQPIGILLFLGLGGYLFDTVGPYMPFVIKASASIALAAWMFAVRGALVRELRPVFTMIWEDEARRHVLSLAGSERVLAIERIESYARSQGLDRITGQVCGDMPASRA
jgi:MFS family permease